MFNQHVKVARQDDKIVLQIGIDESLYITKQLSLSTAELLAIQIEQLIQEDPDAVQ